jgi:hypothetical protein
MRVRNSASSTLPPDFRLHGSVDLKRDRKQFTAIQVIAVLIVAAMVGPVVLLGLLPAAGWSTWVTIVVTVAACLVYGAVHELTHGAVLRLLCAERPSIAVRFPYLITGSPAYLGRTSFIAVALAPSVVWGAVLLVLLVAVPAPLVLTVFVVAVLNFAGSSGDYVQAYSVARLPVGALIRDDGTTTTVFLPPVQRSLPA